MIFEYSAKDTSGNDKKGQIEAQDEKEAIDKLHEQGLIVISVNNEEEIKCPYCAETIKKEAKICRFCKMDLNTGKLISSTFLPKKNSKIADGVKLGFGMFIVLPLIIIGSIIFICMTAFSSINGYGTAVILIIFIAILLGIKSKKKK